MDDLSLASPSWFSLHCVTINLSVLGQPGVKGPPGASPDGQPGFTGRKGDKGRAGLPGVCKSVGRKVCLCVQTSVVDESPTVESKSSIEAPVFESKSESPKESLRRVQVES